MVLAVKVLQALPVNTELGLRFGTGKTFSLAAHELSSCLGPQKSSPLPIFHALTVILCHHLMVMGRSAWCGALPHQWTNSQHQCLEDGNGGAVMDKFSDRRE